MRTFWLFVVCFACLTAGCAQRAPAPATPPPLTAAERSDKALQDPFGYSPDWSETEIGGSRIEEDLNRSRFQRNSGNATTP